MLIKRIWHAGRLHRAWHNFQKARAVRRRRARQRRENPQGNSRAGFLVGCGRSGTTMLLHHLARSWAVEAHNENSPAAFDHWRLRDLAAIEQLVAQSYAPVVLLKPLLNTSQTQQFLRRFPDARIIFVFRHFDDVINSSMKKFGSQNRLNHIHDWMANDFAEFHDGPPPAATRQVIRSFWRSDLSQTSGAALYWLFYNRLYFDLGLNEDSRVLLVGYETLVQEPVANMVQICRHLGLRFEPHQAEGIFSSSVGRDSAPDVADEIRAACEAMWDRLQLVLESQQDEQVI